MRCVDAMVVRANAVVYCRPKLEFKLAYRVYRPLNERAAQGVWYHYRA